MMDNTVSRAENVLAQWEHDQHLGGSSIEGAPTGEEWADVVRGLLNRQAVLEANEVAYETAKGDNSALLREAGRGRDGSLPNETTGRTSTTWF